MAWRKDGDALVSIVQSQTQDYVGTLDWEGPPGSSCPVACYFKEPHHIILFINLVCSILKVISLSSTTPIERLLQNELNNPSQKHGEIGMGEKRD